jgi:prepilin-type N-terminal cleavage/methylation domain-containing protein/prepilin-type processing-associated H-X9-DG protein
MKRFQGSRGAFTLIEMLVVVGVLAVVAALLMPAVARSREAARRSECVCHLKQLAMALHNYHSSWNVLPPGYLSEARPTADGSGTFEVGPGWAWGARILPFMEETTPYNAINFLRPITAPESWTARTTVVKVFLCPSESRRGPASFHAESVAGLPVDLAPSSYLGNGGTAAELPAYGGDGVLGRNVVRSLKDVVDGQAETLLLGERSRDLADSTWTGVVPDAIHATDPSWPVRSSGHARAMVMGFANPLSSSSQGLNSMSDGHAAFRGPHPGGANFAMVDGSIRFLKDSTRPAFFAAHATRAGGEVFACDCEYK